MSRFDRTGSRRFVCAGEVAACLSRACIALACTALACVGLCLVGGCRQTPLVPEESLHFAKLAAASDPIPLVVYVAPFVDARPEAERHFDVDREFVDEDEVAIPQATAENPGALEALRQEIVRALDAAQVFGASRGAGPHAAEALPAAGFRSLIKTALASDEGSVLENAYASRVDLVLTPTLKRYHVRYLGNVTERGWYYFSIFAFTQWYFPTWFIDDEDFEVVFEVEVELKAVGSEATLLKKTIRGRKQLVLDDVDRGIEAWPFGAPGNFEADNWQAAATLVAPGARELVEYTVAKELQTIELSDPRLRTRYLLTIGANQLDPKYARRAVLQARTDARGIGQLLLGDVSPGEANRLVPAKNSVRVEEGEATRARIVEALEELARRGREGDVIYVVFAGFGASVAGEPVLCPYDFDPSRPAETGVSLTEVAEILDRSEAEQVVMIDASFAPNEQAHTRSLKLDGAEPVPAAFVDRLRRDGRVWVLSAGLTGQAHSTELPHSNFTRFLVSEATKESAPADEDGVVTLNAIFARVRRAARAAYDPPQTPQWIGSAASPTAEGAQQVPIFRR